MILRLPIGLTEVERVTEWIRVHARVLVIHLKCDVYVLAVVAPIRDILRIDIEIKMLGVILHVQVAEVKPLSGRRGRGERRDVGPITLDSINVDCRRFGEDVHRDACLNQEDRR